MKLSHAVAAAALSALAGTALADDQNINVNFASILNNAGVDYRVILLSRHRVEDRSASESASTSICV